MSVTREQLYAEVWAEPMTRVAARYGVSANYLARVCCHLIPADDIAAECNKYRRRGKLENMINVAGKTSLDPTLTGFAHLVPTKGNAVMHGQTDDITADSFIVLSDTRLIIERLFAGT